MTDRSVRVEVVSADQAFEALGPLWSSLLKRSGSDSLFLTHEWLSAWWRHFHAGRRLFIMRFLIDHEPIGLAPLVIVEEPGTARPRKVEFLGEPFSDLHDVIVTRDRSECLAAMFETIAEQAPEASDVELRLIPEDSPNVPVLRSELASKLWVVEAPLQVLERAAPYIDMEGTWDAYLAGRAPSMRTDLRRQLRRLSALGHVTVAHHTSPEAIRTCARQLSAFSLERFPSESAYRDPRMQPFYESAALTLASNGWLRASSLMLDETTLAVHLGFAYAGVFHYYQPAINGAFESYSPGKLLLRFLIERAFAEGMRRIDLGRGMERYKEAWATGMRPLRRFEAVARRVTPMGRFLARRTRYAADAIRHRT